MMGIFENLTDLDGVFRLGNGMVEFEDLLLTNAGFKICLSYKGQTGALHWCYRRNCLYHEVYFYSPIAHFCKTHIQKRLCQILIELNIKCNNQ